MKSSPASLLARGFVTQDSLSALSALPYSELPAKLHSGTAQERAAAARLLGRDPRCAHTMIDALVKQLPMEKALYARLEICETLSRLGSDAALALAPLLGKIGTNQHRQVPDRVSGKKGFDLPRDLAARTLAKMPEALPILGQVLAGGRRVQVLEALDALGFLLFYAPQLAESLKLAPLPQLAEASLRDDLLRWKYARCLGAIAMEPGLAYLTDLAKNDCHPTIRAEAQKAKLRGQKLPKANQPYLLAK